VVVARPVGGVDFPRTWSEFVGWFPDEKACVAYLERLRWADGFVCPGCGSTRSWPASRGLGSRVCAQCARRTSVTAGTLFAGTRTPLTQWFAAAWHVCSTKNGASALGLQKLLGLGSYETAWAWLHKLRRAMVIPGRDLLNGDVEVDETFVGGDEPGLRGGRARGKKALVAIAVECRGSGSGRTRLARIPDAGRRSLHEFITANIAPGSIVLTDAWPPYGTIDRLGYGHKAMSIRASTESAAELLPRVHRVAALLKRWLDGTHQGAVQPEQLDYYLDEFTFRFNRRDSRARGLLFYRLLHQAVRTGPRPYAALIAGKPIRPAMPITTRRRRHKM
jgi:ISXO2-like transposase domain/Transposase zinc-ribbon domain